MRYYSLCGLHVFWNVRWAITPTHYKFFRIGTRVFATRFVINRLVIATRHKWEADNEQEYS
jgi:hypothetical protein